MTDRPDAPSDLSARTGFAVSRLERLSGERTDAARMAALRARPDARTLLFSGDRPVLGRDGDRLEAWFPLPEAARLGAGELDVLLGLVDGSPRYAGQLPPGLDEGAPPETLAVIDLRTVGVRGLVPPEVAGALGVAKSLLVWHATHPFCARCGGGTAPALQGWRRDCPSCGAEYFPRADPVVIMLVVDGERCLLGRQPRFAPGMYSCLAGFLEPGETIEDAVRRETREEAGIEVGPVRVVASQPWPFPHSIMIGAIAGALSRDITIDRDELEDARWFSRAEAQATLSGTHPEGIGAPQPIAIAHHLLKAWVEGDPAATLPEQEGAAP